MRATQLLAVAVALSLVLGALPAAAVAAPASATPLQTAPSDSQNGTDTGDQQLRASTGQQLATVLAVTDEEVARALEESSVEAAFSAAASAERAELLADRAAALSERASTLAAERRTAQAAYENGSLSAGEYAQRLAVLGGQATSLENALDRLERRAGTVPADELAAAGYNQTAIETTRDRLDTLAGPGARALFAQYTGERTGQFSVGNGAAVSVAAGGEAGERSRAFERVRPGDGSFEVSQADAVASAEASLTTDIEGEWRLESAERDDDGYYELEFTFDGPAYTGEAEVDVDGQTGEVFEFEEELEPREDDEDDRSDDADDDERDSADDDERDDRGSNASRERGNSGDRRANAGDDRDDDRADSLSVGVVGGQPTPGASVTLEVTAAGEAVSNATVELNDRAVGTTDADGRIELTLPIDGEAEIEVSDGEREGELELEFEFEDDEDDE